MSAFSRLDRSRGGSTADGRLLHKPSLRAVCLAALAIHWRIKKKKRGVKKPGTEKQLTTFLFWLRGRGPRLRVVAPLISRALTILQDLRSAPPGSFERRLRVALLCHVISWLISWSRTSSLCMQYGIQGSFKVLPGHEAHWYLQREFPAEIPRCFP